MRARKYSNCNLREDKQLKGRLQKRPLNVRGRRENVSVWLIFRHLVESACCWRFLNQAGLVAGGLCSSVTAGCAEGGGRYRPVSAMCIFPSALAATTVVWVLSANTVLMGCSEVTGCLVSSVYGAGPWRVGGERLFWCL